VCRREKSKLSTPELLMNRLFLLMDERFGIRGNVSLVNLYRSPNRRRRSSSCLSRLTQRKTFSTRVIQTRLQN